MSNAGTILFSRLYFVIPISVVSEYHSFATSLKNKGIEGAAVYAF